MAIYVNGSAKNKGYNILPRKKKDSLLNPQLTSLRTEVHKTGMLVQMQLFVGSVRSKTTCNEPGSIADALGGCCGRSLGFRA
jgi:hypothetical protein